MVNLTNLLLVDFHLVSLFFPIFYFISRGHGYTYVWLFLNILFMYLCMYVSIYLFWPRCTACGILVPQPGIEPRPLAVRVRSPNYWTAREFPIWLFFKTSSRKKNFDILGPI